MLSLIRSFVTALLVAFGGDATGLTIYYLSHVKKWNSIEGGQIVLLVLISLLIAGAEAHLHHAQQRQETPVEQWERYRNQFFVSLLIALMMTYKPL